MKYIIYVKNKKNELVGIYTLKKITKVASLVDIKKTKKDIYYNGKMNNNNLNLLYSLTEDLRNQNISLSQYKCLGKNNEETYFLVKINIEETNLTLNNFQQLNKEDNSYKKTINVLNKYHKKIVHGKHQALTNAILSELKPIDYIMVIIEFTLLVATIVTTLIKNPVDNNTNNCADSFNSLSILLLSIFVVLLQSVKTIIKKINKGLEFKKDCNLTTTIEGESKQDIINKIVNPKTFSKKYKDYQVMNFANSKKDEAFIYSEKQNKTLEQNTAKLKINLEKDKIDLTNDSRKALAYIVSDKLENDKSIFNGKLLGINSDLNFDTLNCVNIKTVRYHSYVSTDEMIFKNICTPNEPTKVISGQKLTLNPLTNGLRDIENSYLTNLIGINIMVELDVNGEIYYIVNLQSIYNDVNGSTFVPSASGSIDINDYLKNKNDENFTFKELLKYAMYRELSEESYIFINKDNTNNLNLNVTNFKVLGFARLASKAGKPDFFGKVQIKLNSVEEITKILNNYDLYQNKYLGSKTNELETMQMVIISKHDLFNAKIEEVNQSPQLQYLIYLLKNETTSKE
ncbi:MAG: hypothetical protein MR002_03635 [Acholeplasmatales bacterium]|nr:hypothetical protein [Acholeplasmatales bacterium]HCX08444.1 hypothetical protein [Acholeplasmatales bacterium]